MDIIDQKKLTALYGHEETALDIIHMFVDQSPKLIEDLDTALSKQDSALLAKICHKGVGQARYIASPLIEETIIDIQKSSGKTQSQHFEKLKSYIQNLSDEYA